MKIQWLLGMAVSGLCAAGGTILAWHEDGHRLAARLAVEHAAAALPAFFSEGRPLLCGCASDPDLFRERAVPRLREQEAPEHYFDRERLDGAVPPTNRYAFVALCARKGLDPADVGFLPYAVIAWTDRLSVVLAEHRKWPGNAIVRTKCLVYAGILSHYAADMMNPLHTTVHYDGRVGADGKSPHTGIHGRVDALLGKADAAWAGASGNKPPASFSDLPGAVFQELDRTCARVDSVYALAEDLPRPAQAQSDNPKVREWVRERLCATVQFVGGLYVTAWEDSASIQVPEWHREP